MNTLSSAILHDVSGTASSAPVRRPGLRAIAVVGLVAAALFGVSTPAMAHDQLIDSVMEQADNGDANALRLTFNNNVLEVGTEMLVTDESGTDAAASAPKVSGRDVVLPLNAPLADGTYRSIWRVVSSDGHPIDGGFTFDITDGKAGPLTQIDPTSTEPSSTPEDSESTDSDAPDLKVFAPYLAIGAGLAAVVVLAAVIMRARKKAAPRDNTQHSPDKE